MRFSFSTLYTTVLTSNILFIIVACFFHSKSVLYKVGYRFLGILVTLALLRLLLPFEFPFTKTLILPESLSFFLTKAYHPLFHIGTFKVTPWKIFLFIWMIGSLLQLFHFIKEFRILSQYIANKGEDVTNNSPYVNLLKEIGDTRKKNIPCRIFKLPGINSPMLCGLFRPCVLLPQQINYSTQELYYILHHETGHYFHHDILLKYALRFISIIYWWNPACHSLRRQTDLLLEMRVDESVTKNASTAQEYLKCLLHAAELATDSTTLNYINTPQSVHTLPISFTKEHYADLKKRFHMLLQAPQRLKRITVTVPIIFISLALLLCFSSHFFIWEASYDNPQDLEGTFTLSKENAYIIKKPDGTYDIYWNGMHIETVHSIHSYSKDIPIYDSEEDLPNETDN